MDRPFFTLRLSGSGKATLRGHQSADVGEYFQGRSVRIEEETTHPGVDKLEITFKRAGVRKVTFAHIGVVPDNQACTFFDHSGFEIMAERLTSEPRWLSCSTLESKSNRTIAKVVLDTTLEAAQHYRIIDNFTIVCG